ncbi:hypothetical protein LEP1GSC170_1459 [Leptospira interrogans serovar Bataviae str. HAI135]|nr:hypothetical protein LEP1GSC170_1459 [Leptospira interrogans serovar Bataviae str. HAI135]
MQNTKDTLQKKDILKLIEGGIGPDGLPFTDKYIFHANPDFAKTLMITCVNLIKDIDATTIENDQELAGHLIYLASFAVTWISALAPTEVKEYAVRRLGTQSPWAKKNTNISNEATK